MALYFCNFMASLLLQHVTLCSIEALHLLVVDSLQGFLASLWLGCLRGRTRLVSLRMGASCSLS